MNKLKNLLVVAAFVLPVLFITTSCDDDDDDLGWSEADIEELVTECVQDENGTEEQCQCLADKVTSKFSKKQLESDDDLSLEDALTILEFASECEVTLDFEVE